MDQDDAIPEQEDPYLRFEDVHLPGDRIEESHAGCEERKLQAMSRSFLSLRNVVEYYIRRTLMFKRVLSNAH
ncbi:hypothetical protein [Rossellomorea marisflavi]|uniref:hypothetical protein n=1 Tax=Rossellomorea marisflavi TaxID=189381 RepID=UPI0034592C9B